MKPFIVHIFFILLGSHSLLKSLMIFINIISPTIKQTFTYSKQTVTFLDVQIYLSETRKLKIKTYRKSTDCITLLHFYSHHPLSCKEGIIYLSIQVLTQYLGSPTQPTNNTTILHFTFGISPNVFIEYLYTFILNTPSNIRKRAHQIHQIVTNINMHQHKWYYFDMYHRSFLLFHGPKKN